MVRENTARESELVKAFGNGESDGRDVAARQNGEEEVGQGNGDHSFGGVSSSSPSPSTSTSLSQPSTSLLPPSTSPLPSPSSSGEPLTESGSFKQRIKKQRGSARSSTRSLTNQGSGKFGSLEERASKFSETTFAFELSGDLEMVARFVPTILVRHYNDLVKQEDDEDETGRREASFDRITAAMLFIDISGFTPLSAKLGAAGAVGIERRFRANPERWA